MPPPATPDPTPIRLLWMATDRLDADDLDALAGRLDDGERQRADQFHFAADRDSYIAAHALVRHLLATTTSRPASSWRFGTGAFGKPYPLLQLDDRSIATNLSHTRGFALAGLSTCGEIGVDIEPAGREQVLDDICHLFAPEEIHAIQTSTDRHRAMLRLWVLKEAYVKARGTGLTSPLDSFAVSIDPPGLLYDRADPSTCDWTLRLFATGTSGQAALAIRGLRGDPNFVFRETDPATIIEGP